MNKKFSLSQNLKKIHRPHIKALIYVFSLLAFSGALSIILYEGFPAWSAILASISAGCITGIIFYILVNIRNNEIQDEKEECENVKKYYQIAKNTIRLCFDCLENTAFRKTHIPEIDNNLNELIIYISTLYFDSPRATKLIKDFPSDYVEKAKKAEESLSLLKDVITSNDNSDDSEYISYALFQIISFCNLTEKILLTPMLGLITGSYELDKSIL